MTPPFKSFALVMTWLTIAFGILYLTIFAPGQVLFANPITPLALGLIGLGMCIDARRKLLHAKAQINPSRHRR